MSITTQLQQLLRTLLPDKGFKTAGHHRDAIIAGVEEAKTYTDEKVSEVNGYTDQEVLELKTYTDTELGTTVKKTGNETIEGVKTFTSSPVVPDATLPQHPVTKGVFDIRNEEIQNSLKEEVFVDITPQIQYPLYFNAASGEYDTSNGQWKGCLIENVTPSDEIYVTGTVRPIATALAVYFNESGGFISAQFRGTGIQTAYTRQRLTIPLNCTSIGVTSLNTEILQVERFEEQYKFYTKTEIYNKEEVDELLDITDYWANKNLWWCGTSIPAGTTGTLIDGTAGNYPAQVGINLGGTVVNKAVGGSMCRANVRTGDYVGANILNITSALTMTKEEIENFIANYDTIKGVLSGTVPATLSASDLARLRSASFEDRLLPYLNGTYQMPDLFVIDHGHNDFKYTLSNGTSDIGLLPTVANIGGELAADNYMILNNNEKLESFFGSLINIPTASKAAFIASLNRNCYVGAVNFITTLILRYNPHARIIFISNYEYENGVGTQYAPLILAQQQIAKEWAIPLCEIYKYLGYSNKIIPNTLNWFNTTYSNVTPTTTDITVYKAYNPDGVHPHSDVTGTANRVYARIITEFIKKI